MRFWLLLVGLVGLSSCQSTFQPANSATMVTPEKFDWQGHRGARGLLPENTIPAFLKALDYPIQTLELDVVVTKDSQVLVSHEPWLSHTICSHSDGSPVTEAQEKSLNVFQLTYAQIRQYDCGSRGNARFPQQQAVAVHKPLLREVIAAVEAHCKTQRRALPFYNIEIKSQPAWDGFFTPTPTAFVDLVIGQIKAANITRRTCIQSFDVRALQAVRQLDAQLTTAFLVENTDGFTANMQKLGFVPAIYSPHHTLVDAALVQAVRAQGMRLIPWTVNDTTTMQRLIALGVDGIITDYPNLIEILEKY